MKTFQLKDTDHKERWFVVDAKGLILGRLATKVAMVLMGKDRPQYTPHVISGDHVVIVNARHVRVTGKKMDNKVYDHYTGYPSGRKTYTMKELFDKKPEEVVMRAVKGMLPRTTLGAKMLKRLRVYADAEHEQQAQQPETMTV